MTPDFFVQLGDFTFTRLEVPEKIDFGGEQSLVIHKLVGGKRTVDALGRDDMPLEWSGLFLGEDALDRARYLDFLRVEGKPHTLTWGGLSYLVVIQFFKCSFERLYKLPYQITCVVVEDTAQPVRSVAAVDLDQAIKADLGTAAEIAETLEETDEVPATGIKAAIADIKAAFKKVTSVVRAVQKDIKTVKDTVNEVQNEIQTAIAATNNTLQDITTMGGILPNNPLSENVLRMSRNVTAVNNMARLENLKYTLSRVDKNVSLANAAPNAMTITVAGGSLYKVAQQQYGDATQWPVIAKANNLTDPQISGVQTLVIPPAKPATGGILD